MVVHVSCVSKEYIHKAFFFNYLVYGSADPIFPDFEEFFFYFFSKKFFLELFSKFVLFKKKIQLQVPSPDKGGGLASGAVRIKNPYGVQYTMKGKSLSPQTQCRDMIPSVNDTEIRKQLSKMGRNKACKHNLLIEEIIMVAELNLLLKDYSAEDNGKWYPR